MILYWECLIFWGGGLWPSKIGGGIKRLRGGQCRKAGPVVWQWVPTFNEAVPSPPPPPGPDSPCPPGLPPTNCQYSCHLYSVSYTHVHSLHSPPLHSSELVNNNYTSLETIQGYFLKVWYLPVSIVIIPLPNINWDPWSGVPNVTCRIEEMIMSSVITVPSWLWNSLMSHAKVNKWFMPCH